MLCTCRMANDLFRHNGNLLMNELPEIGSLYMRRDFWDRHRANIPLNLHMAKGCSKNHFWREINEFSPLFNHEWIKIMLIQGKSKFLLALSRIIFFPEGTVTNPTI